MITHFILIAGDFSPHKAIRYDGSCLNCSLLIKCQAPIYKNHYKKTL